MKVNLKEVSKEKLLLEQLQQEIYSNSELKPFAGRLKKAIRLYEELERDLEISGECIIELDKPRIEAIEERNKALLRKEE